jgi:peptidoglycan/LPS O-acetylase OafA/YrhL
VNRIAQSHAHVLAQKALADRDVTIDVMRGVSILIVLIGHFHNTYSLSRNLTGFYREPVIRILLENEHYGVIIFFAISGFLITSNVYGRYGKLGNVDVREFYAYRFARIYPCLGLFLALVGLGHALEIPRFTFGNEKVPDYLAVLSAVLPFHNILIIYYGWFSYCLNILWSIAIEEAFYLVAPPTIRLIRAEAVVGSLCAVLIVTGPFYRWFADERVEEYYSFLSCFDGIAFGCLTAIVGHNFRPAANPIILRSAGGALVLFASLAKPDVGLPLGVSLVALGTSLVLLTKGATATTKPNWPTRTVCWLGRRSYELYLFHIIVLALMRAIAGPGPIVDALRPGWLIVYLVASAATAAVIAGYYSDPLNRALRQLYARVATVEPLRSR